MIVFSLYHRKINMWCFIQTMILNWKNYIHNQIWYIYIWYWTMIITPWIQCHLIALCSVPFIRSITLFCTFPKLSPQPYSVYKIWNSGWILMLKVSKWLYWSAYQDKIICKWHKCLLGGQKWNLKNYSNTVNKIITSWQI